MKSIITVLFLIAAKAICAQLYVPNIPVTSTSNTTIGNVGIGTSSPESLLTLNKIGSGAQTSEVTLQSNGTNVARRGWNASGYVDISALYSNKNIALSPSGTGNVGIGTTSPSSLLTLNKSGSGAQTSAVTLQSNNVNVARLGWNASGYMDISALYANSHIILTPSGTGNVGIGTMNPDAKLTVRGTVHANEIKVDLNVTGPDYVFDPTYTLPSLDSVQSYINQKQTLTRSTLC